MNCKGRFNVAQVLISKPGTCFRLVMLYVVVLQLSESVTAWLCYEIVNLGLVAHYRNDYGKTIAI